MDDDRSARRYNRSMNRSARRYNRSMNRYQNPMRGIAAGIFIIFLAFAFFFSSTIASHLFLPILFAGLALCALIGAASSGNPRGIYGGLYPFVWLMGLALCFLIGFWPWILIPVGVSMIIGALYNPITKGLSNAEFMANQAPPQTYQPYQQSNEPNQTYQSGYQGPQTPQGTYQEGGQSYQYPPQPKQQYDMPEAATPQQEELPPQQQ
jgi:hypothetical protein